MPEGHATPADQSNIIEADHGKLKQLIRPVRVQGLEVMHALRKGHFNLTRDILGEARLAERAFGLGACRAGQGCPAGR